MRRHPHRRPVPHRVHPAGAGRARRRAARRAARGGRASATTFHRRRAQRRRVRRAARARRARASRTRSSSCTAAARRCRRTSRATRTARRRTGSRSSTPAGADIEALVGDDVEVVNHNAPGRQYAVAGTADAIAALEARLGKRAVRVLPGIDVPFHSSVLRGAVDAFRAHLRGASTSTRASWRPLGAEPDAAGPFEPASRVDVRRPARAPARLAGALDRDPALVAARRAPADRGRARARGRADRPRADHAGRTRTRSCCTPSATATSCSTRDEEEASGGVRPGGGAHRGGHVRSPGRRRRGYARPARRCRRTRCVLVLALQARVRLDQLDPSETLDELFQGVSSRRNQVLIDLGREFGLSGAEGVQRHSIGELAKTLREQGAAYRFPGAYLREALAAGLTRAGVARADARLARPARPGLTEHVLARVALDTRPGPSARGGELARLRAGDGLLDRAVELTATDLGVAARPRRRADGGTGAHGRDEHALEDALLGSARALADGLGRPFADDGEPLTEPDPDARAPRAARRRARREAARDGDRPALRRPPPRPLHLRVGERPLGPRHRLPRRRSPAGSTRDAGRGGRPPRGPRRRAAGRRDRAWLAAAPRRAADAGDAAASRGDAARRRRAAAPPPPRRAGSAPLAAAPPRHARATAGPRCPLPCGRRADGRDRARRRRRSSATRRDPDAPARRRARTSPPTASRPRPTCADEIALVTGASPGSIAAELVQRLLRGGATVVATTSTDTPERRRFYRELYRTAAGPGARAARRARQPGVVRRHRRARRVAARSPAAAGSGRDDLRLDPFTPTLSRPFAALPTTGDAAEAGAGFETALRLQLLGVQRLDRARSPSTPLHGPAPALAQPRRVRRRRPVRRDQGRARGAAPPRAQRGRGARARGIIAPRIGWVRGHRADGRQRRDRAAGRGAPRRAHVRRRRDGLAARRRCSSRRTRRSSSTSAACRRSPTCAARSSRSPHELRERSARNARRHRLAADPAARRPTAGRGAARARHRHGADATRRDARREHGAARPRTSS